MNTFAEIETPSASAHPSPVQACVQSPPLFQRILFATDFAPVSRSAFTAALTLAQLSGARLAVLHVFELADDLCECNTPQLRAALAESTRHLAAMKQQAADSGVCCETLLRAGAPADTIRRTLADDLFDLVVLGTNALHGFDRFIFGSTSETVMRHACRPVLTAGPRASNPAFADQTGPVVFATDFHPTTVPAVRLAAAVAQISGSPLHCIHVLPRALETGHDPAVIPTILTEALQQLAAESGLTSSHPVCATTFGSEVSTAILDYARRHHARLIVLGIREASFVAAHAPAHIAFRIVAESPCPVLTQAFARPSQASLAVAACY